MDTTIAIIIYLIGFLLFLLILSAILNDSMRAKRRDEILLKQLKLLAKIAEKQGVDAADINSFINYKDDLRTFNERTKETIYVKKSMPS